MTIELNFEIEGMGTHGKSGLLAGETSKHSVPYEFTGYMVREGQTIAINVEEGDSQTIRIGFGPSEYHAYDVQLTEGMNYINVERDGPLFLSNQENTGSVKYTLYLPDDAEKIPEFIDNVTTQAELQAQIDANPDLPVYLNGDGVEVLLRSKNNPQSSWQNYLNDAQAVLDRLQFAREMETELAGMSRDGDNFAADGNLGQNMFFVESASGYMWTSGDGYSAYHGSAAMLRLLQPPRPELSWGIWHETGHMLQDSTWMPSGTGEVTVNIYSAHASAITEGAGMPGWRYNEAATADGVFKANSGYKLDLPRDAEWMDTPDNHAVRDIIYRQLYMGFGKEFYQAIQMYYRTISEDQARELTDGLSSEGKASLFAIKASEITGYDLSDFFKDWRYPVSDEAYKTIDGMNLKTLPYDLANLDLRDYVGASYDELPFITKIDIPDLPQGSTNDEIIGLVHGEIPKASDFITPDNPRDQIRFLDENEIAEYRGVEYGRFDARVLITDSAGNSNVLIGQAYVVPEYYANASSEEIYNQALKDYEEGNVEKFDQHQALLRFSNEPDSADLLSRIHDEVMEMKNLQFSFAAEIDQSDFRLVHGDPDIVQFRIDADTYDRIVSISEDFGQKFVLEVGIGEEKEQVLANMEPRNGATLGKSGDDYVLNIKANGQVTGSTDIDLHVWYFRGTTDYPQFEETITGSDLGRNPAVDLDYLQEAIRPVNIINEESGFALALDNDLVEKLNAQGDFLIRLYHNGEQIGSYYNGRTSDFVKLEQHESQTWLTTVRPDIKFEDEITYSFNWDSRVSSNHDAKFQLNVSGGWVGGELHESPNPHDDHIRGDSEDNVIIGGTGNDTLQGFSGDDIVIAGNPDWELDVENGEFLGSSDEAVNTSGSGVEFQYGAQGWGRTLYAGVFSQNENTFGGSFNDEGTILDSNTTGFIDSGNSLWTWLGVKAEDTEFLRVEFDQYMRIGHNGQVKLSVYVNGRDTGLSKTFSPDGDLTQHSADFDLSGVQHTGEVQIRFTSITDDKQVHIDNVKAFGLDFENISVNDDNRDEISGNNGNDTLFVGNNDVAYGRADRDDFYIHGDGASDKAIYVDGGTDGSDRDTLHLNGLKVLSNNQTRDADGDSYSGTITARSNDTGETFSIRYNEIEVLDAPECFARGSSILTEHGEVNVEDLKIGDYVLTKGNGAQPIRWIGKKHLSREVLEANEKWRPVLIRKGALGAGLPERDLRLSPHHRVLINNRLVMRISSESEALIEARFLVGLPGIEIEHNCDGVEYFHILTNEHQILISEGAYAETLLLGENAMQSIGFEAVEEIASFCPSVFDHVDSALMKPVLPILTPEFAKQIVMRMGKNNIEPYAGETSPNYPQLTYREKGQFVARR